MTFENEPTISDLASRDIQDIFARAQEGEITWIEAKEAMDKVEEMREAVGDGWFDRYGLPPEELR